MLCLETSCPTSNTLILKAWRVLNNSPSKVVRGWRIWTSVSYLESLEMLNLLGTTQLKHFQFDIRDTSWNTSSKALGLGAHQLQWRTGCSIWRVKLGWQCRGCSHMGEWCRHFLVSCWRLFSRENASLDSTFASLLLPKRNQICRCLWVIIKTYISRGTNLPIKACNLTSKPVSFPTVEEHTAGIWRFLDPRWNSFIH